MGCTVLVVDDDTFFRHIAVRILRSWGHDVVGEAGGVDEALARTSELRPDAVVVDIGLPDGDGFDLTRRLTALPWPIRVVVISSDSDLANGSVAERVGASGFFPKAEISGASFRQAIEGG
jgi:DNA-binding NarL/FixJ family response regulator